MCGIVVGMKNNYEKFNRRAIELRKKGLSYNEIRKEIKVAKSTLSLWLKSVPLKQEHRKRLYTKQIEILSRGLQSQKERRAREIEKIIKEAEEDIMIPLSIETYRLMGSALYWAEGSKGRMAQITNSDPHLILFMVRWINEFFKISPQQLKARLNIYPQQSERKIKKFWSDLTGIPFASFGKSYVKPVSKGYKKNNLYYGTMRIEIPKSSNIRHRIFGWVSGSLKDIDIDVKFVQQKWQHLANVARPVNLKK